MSEQERRLSEYDRQRAIEEVVATGAVITDEQYQKLAMAVGREVEMHYEHQQYITDEDSSYSSISKEPFVLVDFSFVADPNTDQKYLAFLKTDDGAANFPYWRSVNAWEDIQRIIIEKVIDSKTEETIWLFIHRGKMVEIDAFGSGDIVDAIKTSSISYLDSTRQRK